MLIVHVFVSYAHANLCHFFSSSWCQGLAATSACGSSWTFLFTFSFFFFVYCETFFFLIQNIWFVNRSRNLQRYNATFSTRDISMVILAMLEKKTRFLHGQISAYESANASFGLADAYNNGNMFGANADIPSGSRHEQLTHACRNTAISL